jgi:ABC-type nitrate/sulfonate/bicarbonate transport system substrate-binding protein
VNANRRLLIAFLVSVIVAASGIPVSGEPCCVILVPPPPPPPSPPDKKEPSPASSYGPIYAQLPLLAAIERRLFEGLDVTIQTRDSQTAIKEVSAKVGTLGIASISEIAGFQALAGAKVHVIGVAVNRADYGLFSGHAGPTSIVELKGHQIVVPASDESGRIYVAQVLETAGLREGDVKVVVQDRKAYDPAQLAKAFDRANSGATLAFDGFKWEKWGKVTQLTGPAAATIPLWVLYTSSETLAKEPKQVIQFIKGIDAGLKAVKGDPQLARTLLGRLEVGPATAQAISQLLPLVLPDTVRPNVAQLEHTVRILKDIGYTKTTPALTDEAIVRTIYGP